MPKDATQTRIRFLEAAEDLFLSHGYGGTSVDAIVHRTGLTKGAFFHHFASKQELARAVIERFAEQDREYLQASLQRAERLSRDPLQQLLIVVGLYEEFMSELTEPYPGCLFASYCYQQGLFEPEIHAIVRDGVRQWREVLGGKVSEAMAQHPPRFAVEPAELVDAFLSVIEGAFVLSKTLEEPKLVAQQLRHYRNYLELLFGAA